MHPALVQAPVCVTPPRDPKITNREPDHVSVCAAVLELSLAGPNSDESCRSVDRLGFFSRPFGAFPISHLALVLEAIPG